ncbi:MAG: hypothetical protein HQL01_06675 [Nitrospirae bacterium]|nr:hypothetical protein [Nitrospirota bacterium]
MKFEPLGDFLKKAPYHITEITLSFDQIELLIGVKLPDSEDDRAYWANDRTHSIAKAWLSAGWKTVSVELNQKYVVFEKDK